MAIAQLKEQLTEADYITIEELAEQNHAPSDIARALRVSRRDFLHVWRDKTSRIREAYELGRLQIEIKKSEKLVKMIEAENTTALQIHEKKSKALNFENARLDVFGV